MARNEPGPSEPREPLQGSAGGDDRDEISGDAILRFFRRRYRICLAWMLVGLCLGIIYAAVTPAYYTATASVLLEDQNAKAPDVAVAGSDSAHSTYIETQVQVLGSDEVVGRIVDELHLADDPEFGGSGGGLHALLGKYASSPFGMGSHGYPLLG